MYLVSAVETFIAGDVGALRRKGERPCLRVEGRSCCKGKCSQAMKIPYCSQAPCLAQARAQAPCFSMGHTHFRTILSLGTC